VYVGSALATNPNVCLGTRFPHPPLLVSIDASLLLPILKTPTSAAFSTVSR
jgi:hypothetical protein